MNKATKTLFLPMAFLFAVVAAYAQGPNNTGIYYSTANGKSGAELKTALFNIIKNPDVVSYDGLIDAYKKTDTRPDGYVRDWYSNATSYRHGTDTGGYKKEGDSYNREHTVPQSWFNEAKPMKSDIVHVVPTDGYVNNRRSSYPFGEVGSVTYASKNGYCKLGSCVTSGYSGTVFEPNDEIKGDIARIYFYMVTCYEDRAISWGHSVFSNNKAQGLEQWTLDMMMRWSKQDPVDEVEKARNNAVQEVQGNRNPFVDYPGLEDYIWGTLKTSSFSYDNYAGGSGGGPVTTIAQPVFNPQGGSFLDSVKVSITTTTTDATIYYTTDGSAPSTSSTQYSSPLTFTKTTVLKAIAVKGNDKSSVSEATYVISDGGGSAVNPVNSVIELKNSFFNVPYTGTVKSSITTDFVGTQDGITVTYALGEGNQRFINDSQIRLYPNNKLTLSVQTGAIRQVEFTIAKSSSNELQASKGTVNELKWTGNEKSITFTVSGNSGNLQLTTASVTVETGNTGIAETIVTNGKQTVCYDLQGRRIKNPVRGLYVVNGKKLFLK